MSDSELLLVICGAILFAGLLIGIAQFCLPAIRNYQNQKEFRRLENLRVKGDIQGLIAAFRNDSPDLRRAAVEALKQMKPSASDKLEESLKDEDWRVREGAVLVLGQNKDLRTLELLALTLKDPNEQVRQAGIKTLAQAGPNAVALLIGALNDANTDVFQVVGALGQIGDARAVEPLIALFNNSNNNLRESVARALVSIGAPAVEPLITMFRSGNTEIVNIAAYTLVKIGPAAVEPLVKILHQPASPTVFYNLNLLLGDDTTNTTVRWVTVWTLGEIRDTRALMPLLNALQDSSVRPAVVWALGKLKSTQAVPQLLAYLRDQNKDVRQATAWALGQIRDKQAVEPLLTTLNDLDKDVCKVTAEALVNIGIDNLIVVLKGKSLDTWGIVAEKIGQIGNNQAVQMLVKSLSSQPQGVQQTVIEILVKMGHDVPPPKWPPYSAELSGYTNTVSINNPNKFTVRVGLRTGNQGMDLKVSAQGTALAYVPNGSYSIYFQYSNDPLGLYQGDNFTLYNKHIQISIVKVVGGNYSIRRVG